MDRPLVATPTVAATSNSAGRSRLHPLLWLAPLGVGALVAVVAMQRPAPQEPPTAGQAATVTASPAATSSVPPSSASAEPAAPPIALSQMPSASSSTSAAIQPAPKASAAGLPPFDRKKADAEANRAWQAAIRCRDSPTTGSSSWAVTYFPSGALDLLHFFGPTSPCLNAAAHMIRGWARFVGRSNREL